MQLPNRRLLLASSVPQWLVDRYGPTGALPALLQGGVASDFKKNVYWDSRFGSMTLEQMWALTRTTAEYAVDSTGTWTQFGSGVFARTDLGNNAWEARTNSIRNNSMQGAVAGTPGTLPTNWSQSGADVTFSVVGTGVEDGIEYIDISYVGTSAGVNSAINFETTLGIAASNAQVWTQSYFVKLQSGSLTNATIAHRATQDNSSGTNVGSLGGSSFVPTGTDLGLGRFNQQWTTNQATIAALRPILFVTLASGSVNFTLRIGWPQLELGASVTPPIRTTNAAVTRNADVITMRVPPVFGGAYSMYAKGTPQSPTAYTTVQNLLAISDGTGSNRFVLLRNAATGNDGSVVVSGGTNLGGPTNATVWAQASSKKIAGAITNNDVAQAFNGSVATQSLALPIGVNSIQLGNRGDGINFFDGAIEELAIWPTTRVPNSQLIGVTQ